MSKNEGDSVNPPKEVTGLWENWRDSDGAGPCAHCPRHWSRRKDVTQDYKQIPSNGGRGPWYAEGDFDADVVILAMEPGTKNVESDKKPDNDLERPFEQKTDDIRGIAEDNGSIDRIEPLVNILYERGISTYYTNAAKCNAISEPEDHSNNAEDGEIKEEVHGLCCGFDDRIEHSYLRDELEAVDPSVVITLGDDALDNLLKTYGVADPEPFDNKIIADLLDTSHESALKRIRGYPTPFNIISTYHPSYRTNDIPDKLKDNWEDRHGNGKNSWNRLQACYAQFAHDFCEWYNQNLEGSDSANY